MRVHAHVSRRGFSDMWLASGGSETSRPTHSDLTRLNATFGDASVPGGVALPMAQLVQALNSFVSADMPIRLPLLGR